MQQLFRFDSPRQYQELMLRDIYEALSAKRDILINAPTGIGKTDASIGAALTLAMENGLGVFFLTPKISQHRIALEVLQGIKRKFSVDLSFTDMVGKLNLCVNQEVNMLDSELFYRACDDRVKKGSCRFYTAAKDRYKDSLPADIPEAGCSGHGALLKASFDHGVCAYEISARLARNSRVIVADYAHFLNPYTKQTFLKKIGQGLEDKILIWDEAHNIISAANSYMSSSLSTLAIDNAAGELREVGGGVDLSYLKFTLERMAEKKLQSKSEAFVVEGDMPDEIVSNIGTITEQLEKAAMEYTEKTKAKRSALMHISRFLASWSRADPSTAKILSRHGKGVRISITCLYPASSLQIMRESYANVFMSATMLPLRMYAELLGSEGAEMRNYASPFPKQNRMAVIDDSVTTRYESRSPGEYKKIAARILDIKGRIPGNVAVFFPSFDVLEGVFRFIDGVEVFVQRRGMKSVAVEGLLRGFKESSGAVLMGVMGGSLSEGIDYANNIIKCVIVVGIPLSRPNLETSARIGYLDKRFQGQGADYAYTIPAVIRAIQAAGRAVRSETDRAVIVFMDSRYRWGLYSSLIGNSVPLMGSNDIMESIGGFWGGALKQVAAPK